MEIDRDTLTKLLEALVDSFLSSQHEMILYEMLFRAACKSIGLSDSQISSTVERGREKTATQISEGIRLVREEVYGKLPRVVDLLGSNQDEALRYLNQWVPKGPPN